MMLLLLLKSCRAVAIRQQEERWRLAGMLLKPQLHTHRDCLSHLTDYYRRRRHHHRSLMKTLINGANPSEQ
jgi:hypothetical protein